jgi:uncharacterized protein (UPF0276 family)
MQLDWCGVGLGLRMQLIPELQSGLPDGLHFVEVAPENWAGVGGRNAVFLRELSQRMPVVLHGLCLNLGGQAKLNEVLLNAIAQLACELQAPFFSDHLAWTADTGNLYDLMPLPFTEDALEHVTHRIAYVQDRLKMPVGVENVSTYAQAACNTMSEQDFLLALQRRTGCLLHLDVNNVYVNAFNHGFDAREFIAALPTHAIAYLHVAGHFQESETLLIDTHGADVADSVWDLLAYTYQVHGVRPTLLERDFNIPPLLELMHEVRRIGSLQIQAQTSCLPVSAPILHSCGA